MIKSKFKILLYTAREKHRQQLSRQLSLQNWILPPDPVCKDSSSLPYSPNPPHPTERSHKHVSSADMQRPSREQNLERTENDRDNISRINEDVAVEKGLN
jgi:hypothetical protein